MKPVNLFPYREWLEQAARESFRRHSLIAVLCGGLCAALVHVGYVYWTGYQHVRNQSITQAIQDLRQAMKGHDTLKAQVERSEAQRQALWERYQGQYLLLHALNDLGRLWPRHLRLQSLRLEGAQLVLQGEAPDPPSVAELARQWAEGSARFHRPHVREAVQRSPDATVRFVLEMQQRPQDVPGTSHSPQN